MDRRGTRRARWAAIVAGIAAGALTAVFLVLAGPRLPPVAFSVETEYRQYDIGVTIDGDARLLIDDRLSYAPSLSPDGTQLVTGSLSSRPIVVVDLDDGSQEVIANDVFGYGTNVQWSPDGDWLAMSALVRGVDSGGIWAWNLATEELVPVSANQATTYTWVGGDELLICRQIPDPALKDEFFSDRGELWLVDVGEGGDGRSVTGYDESLDPHNPPGNCIGDDMDARVVTP